jgi:hypothetical protein
VCLPSIPTQRTRSTLIKGAGDDGAGMTDPPLQRWAEDDALRRTRPPGSDLPKVDADEAWRRLGRLTEEQRAGVARALTWIDPAPSG